MIGTLLNDRYRLDRELGRGGMGAVYQGYDLLLGRIVAVKVLLDEELTEESTRQLLFEAQAVAKLNHPNIVSVYDAGQAEGVPFIVMEYIVGESLHQFHPDEPEEIARVCIQICDALEEAHSHGIIHRDLKPENVILSEGGLAKLTDFGLAQALSARMNPDGTLTGTVFYISPEQALGKSIDGTTDLYALGVMMYEFASGQLPFLDEDPLAVISMHINKPPQRPGEINERIPSDFEEIIMKLLSKKSSGRFTSAADTRSDLEAFLRGHSRGRPGKLNHNLPLELTSFIGRTSELGEVRRLVRESRLVTLSGVGGTGKTRLALKAARGLLREFPQGIWLVELSTITDADQVPRAIAIALDIREKSTQPVMDTLIEAIRNRQLLLILDNCEHLIGRCISIAERFLTTCQDLKILATSRESLGLPGERNFHVPSMQLPEMNKKAADPETIWQVESMRLFLERARTVKTDFKPDNDQMLAVAKICKRLDGIPLAIELAAARSRALSVEEIADRLSDRFRLLTGGRRNSLPRQATLQALIDWSYDLLTDEEKVLLRRLSVFSSGWSLQSCEEICCCGQIKKEMILDLLTRLVDKSLVIHSERAGGSRYSMLETIRQYALEKLIQAGETETLRNNHLQYYADFSSKICPELWRSEQVLWMDRLEMEHDNIRAALDWSLCGVCGPLTLENGMRIAGCVYLFWLVRGYWTEAWDWMGKLLASPYAGEVAREVLNRLNYTAGRVVKEIGDVFQAKELFENARKGALGIQDQSALANALLGLGEVALSEHFMHEATKFVDQSLVIFRSLDDKVGIAYALAAKGAAVMDLNGYDRAREYYQQNLDICRELGHQLGVAGTLLSLGRIETFYGDKKTGRKYLEESMEIFRSSRDKSGIAGALSAIGLVELYTEEFDSSKEHYQEALRITRELRTSPGIGTALIALGEIARMQDDFGSARDYYEEALEINEHLGQVGIMMIVAHNLGYVAKQQGDAQQALQFFRRSLQQAVERDHRRFMYFCLVGVASVYVDLSMYTSAAVLFGFADQMAQQEGYKLDTVDAKAVSESRAVLEKAITTEEIRDNYHCGLKMELHEAVSLAAGELQPAD